MTLARNLGSERADEAGWPWSHRRTFLERLGTHGYAAVTIQEYRTIAGRLCEAIEKRALRIGDLDGVRSCAASVKFADVTNAALPSTTTHFA